MKLGLVSHLATASTFPVMNSREPINIILDEQSEESVNDDDGEQIVYRHQDVVAWNHTNADDSDGEQTMARTASSWIDKEPVQSHDSLIFKSLLMLLTNPRDSQPSFPWQKYLSESIKNQRCSVLDLCNDYKSKFKCDHDGHLTAVRLDQNKPFDHLNLLMLPSTVTDLRVRRTKLKTVSKWHDLKGKSLKCLKIQRNSDLNLNLDGLIGELNHLPLESLTVSMPQIAAYFSVPIKLLENPRVDPINPAFSRIGEWMKRSTLVQLRIESSRRNILLFCRDGLWSIIGKKERNDS